MIQTVMHKAFEKASGSKFFSDRTALNFKLFYLFFFAAFGSLFPLIAVYFKQLGMNAVQTGVLIGLRPLVEYFCVPMWAILADRWQKRKLFLLISLFCWIIFTLGLCFVKPAPHGCLVTVNSSINLHAVRNIGSNITGEKLIDTAHLFHPYKQGNSPVALNPNILVNRDSNSGRGLVVPLFATVVYRQADVNKAFALLLFLIGIGEIFSSPAISLADVSVLEHFNGDNYHYGKQRMFGSLGWGITMFFIGIALDQSRHFPDHPCGHPGSRERNYIVCFIVFTVFMFFAVVAAAQFKFFYEGAQESMYFKVIKDRFTESVLGRKLKDRHQLVNEESDDELGLHKQQQQQQQYAQQTQRQTYDPMGGGMEGVPGSGMTGGYQPQQPNIQPHLTAQQQHQPTSVFENDPMDENYDPYDEKYLTESSSKPFANWGRILRHFRSVRLGAILFLAWFMGYGVGLVFAFLFWHLQDLGGTPTLFGIASVINHTSEVISYFLTNKLISLLGYTKLFYLGLIGNIVRFLYVSWLTNPWWVLPFEMIQGLTHAAVWAAILSYATQALPDHLRSTSSSILQGIHHGLGKGCGALIGGLIIAGAGSDVTFRVYGVSCCVVLLGFAIMNYFMAEKMSVQPPQMTSDGIPPTAPSDTGKRQRDIKLPGEEAEPKDFLQEEMYLSPHGIPFAPTNRELSSSRLNELATSRGDTYDISR